MKYWKRVAGDKTGNAFDRKYFTSYLRMFLFDNNSIFNFNMEEDWNGRYAAVHYSQDCAVRYVRICNIIFEKEQNIN